MAGKQAKTIVGADLAVRATSGVLKRVICLANGTLAGVYDHASSATGTNFFPIGACTAGQSFELDMPMSLGIFADWTSGSFLFIHSDY